MNQNDERHATPTLGKNLRSDGANGSSKGEAQTNYQTNVPISNLEVPTSKHMIKQVMHQTATQNFWHLPQLRASQIKARKPGAVSGIRQVSSSQSI